MAEGQRVNAPAAAREKVLKEQQPERPIAEPTTESKDGDWDGHGDRLLAVRRGDADVELVANGLTQFPYVEREVKTDEHTGRFIAEANLDPAPEEEQKPPRRGTAAGEVVEGYSEEQVQKFLTSGAIRRETKDEARESDKS